MDFGKQKYKLLYNVSNKTLNAPPYVEHEVLVERANAIRPLDYIANASSFSSWVFDLSHPRSRNYNRSKSLLMGRVGEQRVEYFRAWSRKDRLIEPMIVKDDEWVILEKDPLNNEPYSFQASALLVNGRALQCRPDVVLWNKETDDVIIIERKITKTTRIPKAGWPNVKAQLWCYSHIDKLQFAQNIFLTTQIFIFHEGEYRLTNTRPRWDRDDIIFQKQQRELFALYGGSFTD